MLKITDSIGNEIPPLVKTSYTFTNRELDEESGLYYYRARYYDAHSGRFMQEDPHPGISNNPETIVSRYNYALNNPNMYADPEGKFIIELIVITLVQTAIMSAMQNGSWWDNFKNSFNTPFSGRGDGQFWDNLLFNGVAMGVGFNPGINETTGRYLLMTGLKAEIDDKVERDGYTSNWLGIHAGWYQDILNIVNISEKAYTAYQAANRLKDLVNFVPSYARGGI